jgi:hypothetical protein
VRFSVQLSEGKKEPRKRKNRKEKGIKMEGSIQVVNK